VARKKHETPEHLDHLFHRATISRSMYAEFWEGYWRNKELRRSEQRFVDDFVSRNQLYLPFKKRTHTGSITFSKKAAREQARIIGGYVIRVTKTGKPSKHGRYYRAIRRKRGASKTKTSS
jgi:hypothetical protein